MKKSLPVVLVAAILTAGCSGKAAVESAAKPTAEPVAAAATATGSTGITVPDEVGKGLDKAEDASILLLSRKSLSRRQLLPTRRSTAGSFARTATLGLGPLAREPVTVTAGSPTNGAAS